MSQATLNRICRAFTLVAAVTSSAHSQQWSWPEKPKNLQVFPKDWTGARLRPVMNAFTQALGVRCSYCHVGEDGKPLSSYDFVSDDKPNKNRAREMYRMLGSINDHLKKIEPSGDKRVNMWCHTCHQGRSRPMTLEEELGEQYRMKGAEAALEKYRALKQRFYGRGAYDFDESALNNFGYELLGKKDAVGAIEIFTFNTAEHPQSPNTWDSLAEAYLTVGDSAKAVQYYQQVLSLDPANENAKEILKKIKERGK